MHAYWKTLLREGRPLPPIMGAAQDLAAYTPEVWAREALIWLRNRTIMARLVHRDFEPDVAQAGDIVNARRPQTFTAANVTTPITPTELEPENVPVLLNQWKHVTFAVGDKEAALALKGDRGAISAVVEEHIRPASAALAEAVDTSLFGLYTDIATSVGTDGIAIDQNTVIDAGSALNDQKAPADMRSVVVGVPGQAALLKTAQFTSAQWDPANVDALRSANLGPKYGFGVIAWSQLVTKVAQPTPPDFYYGLAFHRNAFALVVRPIGVPVPNSGTLISTVSDPIEDGGSGLAVRLEMGRSLLNKRNEISLDILYGVKTLDANLAVVIKHGSGSAG